MSWSAQQRADYAQTHNFKSTQFPEGPVANGKDFAKGLKTGSATTIDGSNGVQQVVNDLAIIDLQSGPVDDLVIGDHGSPGNQRLGNDPLTPQLNPTNPTLLDELTDGMRDGGTLVLAGRSVFAPYTKDPNKAQDVINEWQAYADERDITIIGSIASVGWATGSVTSVWVGAAYEQCRFLPQPCIG